MGQSQIQSEQLTLFKRLFFGNPSAVPERFIKIKSNGQDRTIPDYKLKQYPQAQILDSVYYPLRTCKCQPPCGTNLAACPTRMDVPWNDELLSLHLSGRRFFGIYPLDEQNRTVFCSADFDGHRAVQTPEKDLERFLPICEGYGIPVFIERSQSGTGYHPWIFFDSSVTAWKARCVELFLLHQAQVIREEHEEEASFDRIFPNQDERPGGGYGNLIALPLHGERLQYGNTAFLDPQTFQPYPDQWALLEQIFSSGRISEAKLDELIEENDLGKAPAVQRPGTSKEIPEQIPQGKRHSTLVSLAGSFRRPGMTPQEIYDALHSVNVRRCSPPLTDVEVRAIADSMAQYTPAGLPKGQNSESGVKRTPQAQILVDLAAPAELFHTPEGDCFATIPVARHVETWPLRAKGFRHWLVHRFYSDQGRPPGMQALSDALRVLEAQAQFDGKQQNTFVRIGRKGEAIYLDLANEAWEVVEITKDGWRVLGVSPVKFRRARGILSLDIPKKGGNLGIMRRFVNSPEEGNWKLLVGWLLGAFRPAGPYPLLLVQGEQGSAKSTATKMLRFVIDPSTALLRTAPREDRDLLIAATNSWILAFDNLSTLSPWISDALCRLSTGGGFATRELYTDADEVLFNATRPVILNGIDELATRQDLADRALVVTLPQIQEEERREEETLWREFEEARPLILGALLDAVSAALRNIDKIKLPRLPRMADFALWVTAAEEALGWEKGSFLETYMGNRKETFERTIDSDAVSAAVNELLGRQSSWEGTAKELFTVLEEFVPERTKQSGAWPKTPRGLADRLRRAAPAFRMQGIQIEFYREAHTRKRIIRVRTGR